MLTYLLLSSSVDEDVMLIVAWIFWFGLMWSLKLVGLSILYTITPLYTVLRCLLLDAFVFTSICSCEWVVGC